MKSLLFTLLIAIVCFGFLNSAQADPGDYAGTQFVAKANYYKPLDGTPLQTYFRLVYFGMPASSFNQWYGYFGLTYHGVSPYIGTCSNWRGGKDVLMPGVNIDIPKGNFLFSTEFDVIPSKDFTDLYLWSGIDYNFSCCGNAMWFGPQVEIIRTDLVRAQGGFRLGFGRVDAGVYTGDQGWNARFGVSIL